MHIRELPPLRQSVNIVTPSGRRYRWADDEPDPANIPSGLRHSDTMPGGYETFDCTLPRKPGIDYSDLERFSTATVYDAGGENVGEFRLERAPRISGDQMAVSPSAVGWQAHLDDNKSATLPVIDRELGRWKGLSRQRRINVGSGYNPQNDGQVVPDTTTGEPSLKLEVSGHIAGASGGFAESFYDAGAGNLVASVQFESSDRRNISGAAWDFHLYSTTDDIFTSPTSETGDLGDTSVAFRREDLGTPRRWVAFQVLHGATYVADENERWRMVKHIAVIGDHGLPLQQIGASQDGFLASDIVRHIVETWAPLLNVTDESFVPSTFPIEQFAFHDRTSGGELVRQATRFGLEDWAVWEKRTFYWHPRGARGKRWRARVGPAKLEETGPQADRLWESIIVQYQDVDGSTRTVGPVGSGADTEDAVLTDTDPENPVNKLALETGEDFIRRDLLVMGVGTIASATEIGRRFLEEQKLLDRSGRAQIVGHVMDDRGVLYPYSRVKAGDYISFIDAADTSYRRVVRADKVRESRSGSIDLDAPPEGLAALLERLGVVLVPLGVG